MVFRAYSLLYSGITPDRLWGLNPASKAEHKASTLPAIGPFHSHFVFCFVLGA